MAKSKLFVAVEVASRSQIVILKSGWGQNPNLLLCAFTQYSEPVAICDRFPEDFTFHPNAEGTKSLRSQFVTLKRASDHYCHYFPYLSTECCKAFSSGVG